MKISLLTAVLLLCTFIAFSQEENDGNVISFQTFTIEEGPEDGSLAEMDSLMSLVTKNIDAKSDLLLSQRVVRHYWGADSREMIIIREFKNIQDMIEFSEKSSLELFEAYWDTEEKRKAFNEAYSKYWEETWHSDEIYQEMPGGRIDK